MNKLFRFIGGVAATAAAVSGVAYYLQKKGLLKIEVNYDGKNGKPVTRQYDEIIDTAIDRATKKVTDTVTSATTETRKAVAEKLDDAGTALEDLADTVKPETKKKAAAKK